MSLEDTNNSNEGKEMSPLTNNNSTTELIKKDTNENDAIHPPIAPSCANTSSATTVVPSTIIADDDDDESEQQSNQQTIINTPNKPPPPHAFDTLPLTHHSVLSSSQATIASTNTNNENNNDNNNIKTSSSSSSKNNKEQKAKASTERMYQQSRSLGYVSSSDENSYQQMKKKMSSETTPSSSQPKFKKLENNSSGDPIVATVDLTLESDVSFTDNDSMIRQSRRDVLPTNEELMKYLAAEEVEKDDCIVEESIVKDTPKKSLATTSLTEKNTPVIKNPTTSQGDDNRIQSSKKDSNTDCDENSPTNQLDEVQEEQVATENNNKANKEEDDVIIQTSDTPIRKNSLDQQQEQQTNEEDIEDGEAKGNTKKVNNAQTQPLTPPPPQSSVPVHTNTLEPSRTEQEQAQQELPHHNSESTINSDNSSNETPRHSISSIPQGKVSGTSSPSVLSSKGCNSNTTSNGDDDNNHINKNKKRMSSSDLKQQRNEKTCMNHLSLLLDLHRRNEKQKQNKKKNNKKQQHKTKDGSHGGGSSNVSVGGGGYASSSVSEKSKRRKSITGSNSVTHKKKSSKNTHHHFLQGYKTDSSRTSTYSKTTTVTKSLHHSSSSSQQTNHYHSSKTSDTSLFENFEKNWTTTRPTSVHVERLCFSSAVIVLLNSSSGSGSRDGKGRRNEVSLDLLKLFWKKAVLPHIGLPVDDVDVAIENITETLFENLRYLIIVRSSATSSSNAKNADPTIVRLSHEVYGEYAKYIMTTNEEKSCGLYEKFRRSFIALLEKASVSGWEAAETTTEAVPSTVRNYAATFLPMQILAACRPLSGSSSCAAGSGVQHPHNGSSSTSASSFPSQGSTTSSNRKKCLQKFVKVMTDPLFLSNRMFVFGSSMTEEENEEDTMMTGKLNDTTNNSNTNTNGAQKKKSRKRVNNAEFVRTRWDVVKATHLHLKDVEHFATAAENYEGDWKSPIESTGTTAAKNNWTGPTLAMYKAWQIECFNIVKVLKKRISIDYNERIFGRDSCTSSPISGSPNSSVVTMNTSSSPPASSTTKTTELRDKRSAAAVTSTKLQQKRNKSKGDAAYVRSLEIVTDGLPERFLPLPGEYTVSSFGDIIALKKKKKKSIGDDSNKTMTQQQGLMGQPLPRVRLVKRPTRTIATSPVMRLSDILAIDLRVLWLKITIGKAMNLLSKSISKIASSSSSNSSSQSDYHDHHLNDKISCPVMATTKVKYASLAIETYSKSINVLSFLLSEDSAHVKEQDLIDLGYHDDGRGSLVTRLKRLKRDRQEGRGLVAKLRVLCAESWYDVGRVLVDAGRRGDGGSKPEKSTNAQNADTNGGEGNKEVLWDSPPEKLENQVLHCYQFALSLLQSSKTRRKSESGASDSNGGGGDNSFSSLSTRHGGFKDDDLNIGTYKRTLIASLIHSIGVQYYAHVGNLETAKLCLYEALSRRRLLLRELQKEGNESGGGSRPNTVHRSSRRYSNDAASSNQGSYSSYSNNNAKNEKARRDNNNDLLFTLCTSKQKQIASMEVDLSYTLEFAALTSHSLLDHQTSVSFFQEAIILRALHVGKHSLDVARLHYNMGVIHDDLGQHQASLSRYGKSLKIRLSHLDRTKKRQASSSASSNDINITIDNLEASVVLTLRCMGNVYRALKDATNSLGCYIKAIEFLKAKLKRRATEDESSSFGIYQEFGEDHCDLGFGRGMACKPIDLPNPESNLDDIQQQQDAPIMGLLGNGKDDGLNDSQAKKIRKNASDKATASLSPDDQIRKDIANMYSMLLTLVNDRKEQQSHQQDDSNTDRRNNGYLSAGYSSGGYNSASSVSKGRKNNTKVLSKQNKHHKRKKLSEHDDDAVILLNSAYNLGRITMHFGEYSKAMCYFEEAFRTFWTTMAPSSVEGSDSDYSSKGDSALDTSLSSAVSKPSKKSYYEGEVEEGMVYHAMAIAHAALSEHVRAVRCFLTALRHYRHKFGLNSLKVAGVLYDCGLSYWRLDDYDKAEDFWADCLRIVFLDGKTISSVKRMRSNSGISSTMNTPNIEQEEEETEADADFARILHNLGNVHLQSGHLDVALQAYEESLTVRKRLLNIGEIGSCAEIISQQLRHLNVNKEKRTSYCEKLREIANTLHNIGWLYEMRLQYEKALNCLNQALYIKQILIQDDDSVTKKKKGNDETMMRNSLQMSLTRDEINLGKSLSCAVTLVRIGSVHTKLFNYDIGLSYYKAALCVQRKILGPDHIAVARTLFDMGQIANHSTDTSYTSHYSHEEAIICFNEALRIAKLQYGQHHHAVAGVMYDIGSIHDRSGNDLDAIFYYKNSVTAYGRIYAYKLMRRFCLIPVFRTVESVSAGVGVGNMYNYNGYHPNSRHHQGFNPATLHDQYSAKGHARSSVEGAEAIAADDKDRELFLRASVALNAVAMRSGVSNEFSFLSWQLAFLKFFKGLTDTGSVGTTLRDFYQSIFVYFERTNTTEHQATTITKPTGVISDSYVYAVQ